eukprot:6911535-Lingulodinium_polyedra.AAC.1
MSHEAALALYGLGASAVAKVPALPTCDDEAECFVVGEYQKPPPTTILLQKTTPDGARRFMASGHIIEAGGRRQHALA